MLTSFLSEPFCLFLLLLMCISGAASIGNPECIKVLLNNCFTPDPKDLEGMTPLLYAIAAGHTDCAKLLFEYGANIAARDKNQRGSIHLAVENEKAEMLKMLLERSGSQCINIPDIQERTALHYAASSTKLKVQAILKSDFRPYLLSLKWVWLDS